MNVFSSILTFLILSEEGEFNHPKMINYSSKLLRKSFFCTHTHSLSIKHTHTHIHIHIHTHTCTHEHAHTHTYTHTNSHMNPHTHMPHSKSTVHALSLLHSLPVINPFTNPGQEVHFAMIEKHSPN